MPWVEAIADPQQLRGCIRDLVALSTLPAIWQSYDPHQIAESIAAALVSMLDAEVVYVSLRELRDEPAFELTRTRPGVAAGAVDMLQRAMREAVLQPDFTRRTIPNPAGDGLLHLASSPIGLGTDAVIAAGSGQESFPSEIHRLLLGIAANESTIGLQRWAAEREEQRFGKLIERSSDFIAMAGLDGIVHYVNSAGLQLVGLTRIDNGSPLHVLDFLTPEDRGRAHDEYWPRVMRDGRWIGELNFRHFQTGAAIPFLVEGFRIDHPRTGRLMNIATVSRDLTAQKRSEAQLRRFATTLEQRVAERTAELAAAHQQLVAETGERERVAARLHQLQLELFHAGRLSAAGEMAAALAHEINQPLAAITNSVAAVRRLLQRSGHERVEAVSGAVDDVVAQALRASQIIRRLRDFVTRGETEMELVNVTAMIEEGCALALTGTGALGLNLQFRFDPRASQVFANRVQIQQVLVNLVRNAVEAMANSARRDLAVATALTAREAIEIAVIDSGPGLAHEVQMRLFEPFVSTRRGGMGIGLSICRSIVEAHSGKIWTEPNEGGGTVFRFTLPTGNREGNDHAG